MTRWPRPLVIFCLLSFALAGVSWAQPAPSAGKGSGPGGFYNPETVVTVSGIVISITPPRAQLGLPELVYLTLKTESAKITVFLGPSVALDQMPVKIKTLDKVEVTGSKVMWEGQPVIIAGEVKKGDQVLKLRDPNGVPVWSGRGPK
ncbi:MAG: hypothetical protein WC443_11850 [Desulfobaccales bacterium]